MSVLIVYKSVSGFTARYAALAADKTGCQAAPLKEAAAAGCDTVIFGGRLHAGIIDGLKQARALLYAKGTAKRAVFAVGGMPSDSAGLDEMWKANLTAEELFAMPHFYLPGGICYERLPLPDRLLMKAAAKMIMKKSPGITEDLTKSYDIFSEAAAADLIAFITACQTGKSV